MVLQTHSVTKHSGVARDHVQLVVTVHIGSSRQRLQVWSPANVASHFQFSLIEEEMPLFITSGLPFAFGRVWE